MAQRQSDNSCDGNLHHLSNNATRTQLVYDLQTGLNQKIAAHLTEPCFSRHNDRAITASISLE